MRGMEAWALPLVLVLVLVAIPGDVIARHGDQGYPVETYRSTREPYHVFDDAIVSFMEKHGIHAGSFAISYEDELLWTQGYGTMERYGEDAVPPDSFFRLASVSKPITAAAIHRLADTLQLSTSDQVFCLGAGEEGIPGSLPGSVTRSCHLDLDPPEGADVDPRLAEIDIGHLLTHRGGWDRQVSGDVMWEEIEIARSLGVDSPPTREEIARYVLGLELDFDPGERRAYSNLGYMLLGLIIEDVTGEPYMEYVHDSVFLGADEKDIYVGNTLPANRDSREPDYHCFGETWSVFAPETQTCWPDGGFYVQAHHSAGGLIASAPTIAWFLDHYWLDGEPRPPATSEVTTTHYWFFGSLPGTWTLARQHPDGFNMVLLLNQRWHDGQGAQGYPEVKALLDEAVRDYQGERASPLPPNLDDPGGVPIIGPQTSAEAVDPRLVPGPLPSAS